MKHSLNSNLFLLFFLFVFFFAAFISVEQISKFFWTCFFFVLFRNQINYSSSLPLKAVFVVVVVVKHKTNLQLVSVSQLIENSVITINKIKQIYLPTTYKSMNVVNFDKNAQY